MISVNTGFNMIMQNKPIETRLVISKDQMRNMKDDAMPDTYIALCSDDNNLYAYSKNFPVDSSTGKYRLYAKLDTGYVPPVPGERPIIYGFRIDSTAEDVKDIVSYLPGCENYEFCPVGKNEPLNGGVKYGSWPKDAFFIPRPCALKYDGTVDYYLNSTNFRFKEDGTSSDIDNENYDGNFMLEWGRDGNQIWYKIVPNDDGRMADIYIANKPVDNDYHAWSFIGRDHTKSKDDPNAYVLKDHFYTALLPIQSVENPVSNIVTDGPPLNCWKYRDDYKSLDEIMNGVYAKYGQDSGWLIDTYSDRILITLLTIMITKTVNIRKVVGCTTGDINQFPSFKYTDIIDTMTIFGSNNTAFFMPYYLGTIPKYALGLTYQPESTSLAPQGQYTYKLCLGKSDGSTSDEYNLTGNGYAYCDNPDKPAKTPVVQERHISGLYFERSGLFLPGAVRYVDPFGHDEVRFDDALINVMPDDNVGIPTFGSSYDNENMSIFELSTRHEFDRADERCGASLSYR